MPLPTPPPYSNPIPNNPFYTAPVYTVQGPYYPITVGPGLNFNPLTAILTSTGGGGGVTSIVGGLGIGVSAPTGTVTLTNTGVTSLIAGSGISLSGASGAVTITNAGATGTVTTVSTGTGLIGGPISTTGTIAIDTTGVVAGSYANPTLTVNAQGQITSATAGTALQSIGATLPISVTTGVNPVVSIDDATTLVKGAVLLSDSINTASSSEAATSCAVKCAYDVAVAAIPKSCITGLGSLVTGTAANTPVALPPGADGTILTACSTCATGLYWATGGVTTQRPTVLGAGYGIPGGSGVAPTNVANGYQALGSLPVFAPGFSNTAMGYRALFGVSFGACNTAVGTQAGENIDADLNTVIGSQSGTTLTTGACNVILGALVEVPNPAGSAQLAVGVSSSRWLTGDSTFAIKPGAGIIDCANSCGTAGQVLMSNGSNAICWGTAGGGASAATPTSLGTVYGRTLSQNTALGCNALLVAIPGGGQTAVGSSALAASTGLSNVAVGCKALCTTVTGGQSVAVGTFALECSTGDSNVGVGYRVLGALTTGSANIAIGAGAGCNITTGGNNVTIGLDASVASPTGSCQLAIGFSDTNNWLTGNSTKAIKPGAGVIDCTNSCGTADYVLTSQGNAVQWKNITNLITPSYGLYATTATLTPTAINTGEAVALLQVEASNINLANGLTGIQPTVEGRYQVQATLQLLSTAGGGGTVEVWFSQNGVDILDSNARFFVGNINQPVVATVNYFAYFNGTTDYLDVVWATSNTNLKPTTLTSTMGGPDIPSALVTVTSIGA